MTNIDSQSPGVGASRVQAIPRIDRPWMYGVELATSYRSHLVNSKEGKGVVEPVEVVVRWELMGGDETFDIKTRNKTCTSCTTTNQPV